MALADASAPPGGATHVRVLVTGATGYLGHYVAAAAPATVELVAPSRASDPGFDLAEPAGAAAVVAALRPDVVVHLAALASMAACERDPALALRVNVHATAALCRVAPRVVLASTDLVFAGDRAPYGAGDPPRPKSVYGRTKVRAEEAVLATRSGLVVRLPLLFGRSFSGDRGATDMIRAAAAANRRVTLFTDEYRTPLHAADAAAALWQLVLGERTGIVHVAGRERVSRWELGQRFVAIAGLRGADVVGAPSLSALRPKDVALFSDVAIARTLQAALAEC